MLVILIFIFGVLRILQAHCNKQTSSLLNSNKIFFQYGAYFEFAAAVFSFLYVCIVGMDGLNGSTLACASLTAIFFVTELLTSLEAMKSAPLVLCNMCAMGGGIVLVSILAIYFFQEPMSIMQWIGVVVFFVAVYCLSPKNEGRYKMTAKSWIMLGLNFLINAACSFVGKYFAVRVEHGNAAMFSFLSYLFSAVLFIVLLGVLLWKQKTSAEIKRDIEEKIPKRLLYYGAFLGFVCASIVFLNTILARVVPVVILNTVPSVISILGCLFLGAIIFKEKITSKNIIGVILGIASVVMIAV